MLTCYVGKNIGDSDIIVAYSCRNGSLFVYSNRYNYHQGDFQEIQEILINFDYNFNLWILVKDG
jgi:hypothetical protein